MWVRVGGAAAGVGSDLRGAEVALAFVRCFVIGGRPLLVLARREIGFLRSAIDITPRRRDVVDARAGRGSPRRRRIAASGFR
ncbi:MAG: hypothetical protein WBV52_01785, partial [Pseudolabrys sp.]